MFEPEITEASHHLCQFECRIDATPEEVIEAWRDPGLFDSHVVAAPDADVTLERRSGEKVPSSIFLGNADAAIVERLPLRIAYETTPDLALMVSHEECADDALTVCLTLTVATEPNLTGQGQNTTPCALTLSPPPFHYRLAILETLASLAQSLSERVKVRMAQRKARAKQSREAERQQRIAEGQVRKAQRAECRSCAIERHVFGYEGDLATAHRCRWCLARQMAENPNS
ncbi:hypothetical protein GCM10007301_38280 [Azorhizobium oxalatiphilum]|uniref:Uncharacterized protein n=1 Tax=Azorhizobium oxalatiphilum TaxID=980631 RepID=A0A917C7J7_9HYPH|nr:hypothetical protein [Azorhizobium oxalatiphilum]GGF74757.1 hypothetical protein GCM10007301_38280 [Azorhizobium oxalatiphilum]